jgi:hypothetical protein
MRETFDCHWKEVYVGGAEHSVVCNYSLIRDGFCTLDVGGQSITQKCTLGVGCQSIIQKCTLDGGGQSNIQKALLWT